MFEKMIELLKSKQRSLVFTEGTDARILEAAHRLHKEKILQPILLGNPDEVRAAGEKCGFPVDDGIEIIDPLNYSDMEAMVSMMAELRKGKDDEAACRAALRKSNYFGTMLVKMGKADALLGGATYSTADTVRPALQIIKTKPGNKIVSSCFILHRRKDDAEELYAMADCAINLDPNEDQLAEIAVETAKTARVFSIDPRVALLSYSTLGSGKGESVEKMRRAMDKLKALNPDFPVDGELQFDAAFSPEVAKTKASGSLVAGKANTFIFPNIDAGNIGYKIAQRLGGFEAYGPILQGLNAPINDLSRGCNADEVYKMSIITAALI
ncbi:phosphate acetyltransferase [Caproiciproducens galactitolivorans]|uniref:Phosphate acetyltransferase n=1 Tax=Caproiciproducens galactitolivorans TaxID=642589 RepID=A0A4Z0XZ40_9FIRM|nr:phosphate acetyltransferase [Caproiciproducens galactitolivorans]QEY35083.1 phosphate acetyltransferase [Caproiciproducens galactitolivorans]TGJ76694.1 phosphate acetyltransferase [Caproiciproducens galactitolivorans]